LQNRENSPLPSVSVDAAASVLRFATLTDCDAEPTGIYFDMKSKRLFVNMQHRGGDKLDKVVAIEEASK